jgi:kinesin family protein 5
MGHHSASLRVCRLWRASVTHRVDRHLFNHIEECQDGTEFTIKCSFLEIYLEKVRDLLDPRHEGDLKVRETPEKGVWVDALSEHVRVACVSVACARRASLCLVVRCVS